MRAWRAHLQPGAPRWGRLGDDSGWGMAEVFVAMTILATLSIGLSGMFAASLRTFALSREKTVAEQIVSSAVEDIRKLPYDQVGTQGGNPAGTVPAARQVIKNGLTFTTSVNIAYVDDPVPGGFQTYANYKKVAAAVTSSRSTKVLASVETKIAPPTQPSLTKGVIRLQVIDYVLNQPMPGVAVQLTSGPDAARTATTDENGKVVFAALTPNPASGPMAYYELNVISPTHNVLKEDKPPSPAARVHIGTGQLFSTVLRAYLSSTLIVDLRDAEERPFRTPATVKVSSTRNSDDPESFPVVNGSIVITHVKGEPIVPSIEYTVRAEATGMIPDEVHVIVPDNYPAVRTTTVTLHLRVV